MLCRTDERCVASYVGEYRIAVVVSETASNEMQKSRSTGVVFGGTGRSNIESWPLRLWLCPVQKQLVIPSVVLVGGGEGR